MRECGRHAIFPFGLRLSTSLLGTRWLVAALFTPLPFLTGSLVNSWWFGGMTRRIAPEATTCWMPVFKLIEIEPSKAQLSFLFGHADIDTIALLESIQLLNGQCGAEWSAALGKHTALGSPACLVNGVVSDTRKIASVPNGHAFMSFGSSPSFTDARTVSVKTHIQNRTEKYPRPSDHLYIVLHESQHLRVNLERQISNKDSPGPVDVPAHQLTKTRLID
ncbi:hypothetical protein CBL_07545 [Carabus blaptoides fortunei]